MNFKIIKDKFFPRKMTAEQSRNKKMIILMPVLILVFLFVITRALKQPASCSANVNVPGQSLNDANSHAKINWKMPEVYPSNLRDPMQPSSSVVADANSAAGNLIVKGIIFSHDRPAAVVDNKIVHQGDIVSGITIKKINKKNIELEMNGKTWTQEVQE
ncbi:MAG: hypothetical protein ABFD79_18550 [Phycisphaerales bacterium]